MAAAIRLTGSMHHRRNAGSGKTPAQRPAGKAKAAKSSAITTSSDVPGMPTFDVDKLKAENAKKEQGQR